MPPAAFTRAKYASMPAFIPRPRACAGPLSAPDMPTTISSAKARASSAQVEATTKRAMTAPRRPDRARCMGDASLGRLEGVRPGRRQLEPRGPRLTLGGRRHRDSVEEQRCAFGSADVALGRRPQREAVADL